ncbi:hypothetical protein [Marinimicrococcus flavescens]|uniref:Alpha/beta hydrolase n=1 Tax=Marinimicrococcus flavescens TaxID=3031815 RepID=A0AAP3UZG1_9PROT|nr:hypothetical protein [Marinimicrococcus flavescens]
MRWLRTGSLLLLPAALLCIAAFGIADSSGSVFCNPTVYKRLNSLRVARHCFGLETPVPVAKDELESGIAVRSRQDLVTVRRRLIEYLWERPGLPLDRLPTSVQTGIDDSLFDDMDNLEHIDQLEIELEFGFLARAYHFLPRRGNGQLAIYHAGHDGSFRSTARATLDALLGKGFGILAFDMPMQGVNGWPERLAVPGGGTLPLDGGSHWDLGFLESEGFAPLRLFMDPLLRAVNHVQARFAYQHIIMLGLSGGGWTTTVYAALDPRISRAYPVAGTLPRALHRPHPVTGRYSSAGDYEQRVPAFYSIAGYLDLYVLGAAGQGRRELQVVNRYDPCCFFGSEALLYEPMVGRALEEIGLGGSFRVFVDDTHLEHAISPAALARIIEDALEADAESDEGLPL